MARAKKHLPGRKNMLMLETKVFLDSENLAQIEANQLVLAKMWADLREEMDDLIDHKGERE